MSFEIIPIAPFQREAKRLIKKYPSLKHEVLHLIEVLKENPIQGESLGNNCYKIRLSIQSKGKGKSGGARVITHIYHQGNEVYLLSIYDKSEQSNISEKQIEKLLNWIDN